ncbi:hypothetical protein AWB81_08305 [Caballeronia arationis]|jgi:hypothetical protein|uniref:Uncharacterized protein n=1 Tax=Caballeronia arationis TaxID=1777142 RepID=A0A7Z7I7E8_9BURK|nr:hypothetical protein AWB81_08305 [Caballeronia arationis]SOE80669.1 hypothetical protein SAMN05446927_3911 [Caballeronia arationis]
MSVKKLLGFSLLLRHVGNDFGERQPIIARD